MAGAPMYQVMIFRVSGDTDYYHRRTDVEAEQMICRELRHLGIEFHMSENRPGVIFYYGVDDGGGAKVVAMAVKMAEAEFGQFKRDGTVVAGSTCQKL